MLLLRGNVVRTFHLTLVLELMIACLWIPPVYSLAAIIRNTPTDVAVPRTTVVTLTFFCLNM